MGFYTTEQKDIIKGLRISEYDDILNGSADFIEKEIAPTAEKIDKEKVSPQKNLEMLAKQGMLASHFPEDYGGLALPHPVHIAILEMVSKACASTGVSMSIHNTCCEGLNLYGTEEQKEKYLPVLISNGEIAAFCLTEADGGTNIFHDMKTVAKEDDDSYVLNGSKAFITNASLASVYTVFAKLDDKVTMFLVDKDTEGLEFSKPYDKDCVRGSVTCDVIFDVCKIPKKNLFGEKGGGAKYCIEMLNKGRVGIAALAVGIAQATLEKSLHYVTTRTARGSPIGNFQLIQERIAEMVCGVDAARHLTYHAASLPSKSRSFSRMANKAKLFASQTALNCAVHSRFIHAGYGCMTESNIERHLRDVWVTLIGEGTVEVLKQTVANLAIKDHKKMPGLSFW